MTDSSHHRKSQCSSVTIIGNGMLAKAFETTDIARKDLVLFCSGVSNSSESSADQFGREKSLLLETMRRHSDGKLVYFSSCAAGLIDTPYYRHKKAMEALIESGAERHLIVRLPQVVGMTKNATLVNFIAANIKGGKPITVFKGARRSLIDVDDVVRLTLYLADFDIQAINVTNSNMVPVEEIVRLVSNILGKSPVMQEGPAETASPVYDGEPLKELLGPDDPIYSAGYSQAVLSKYVTSLCD